jgi:hypothetical protein
MRILTTILQLALTAALFGCDQQHTASDIDARLGHECFERHRDTLAPGTQYEGIKKLVANRLTIKIMNGVEVVTIDCGLNTDGTIQDAAK